MVLTRSSAVTDAGLMQRVAIGDVDAFEAIYDRHHVAVYSLARRMTGRPDVAEEATQDAFLALWRTARHYDSSRASLRTWVLAVVRNRSLDALRRRKVRDVRQDWSEDALADLPAETGTDEEVLSNEAEARARAMVADLPPAQRRVLELAYFGGYTQQQIAEGTGIPLGTVKSRARMGLVKLREAA